MKIAIKTQNGKAIISGDYQNEKAAVEDALRIGANLHSADLRWLNLKGVNLKGANLRIASLCGANLYEADLRGADLRGADLSGADLSYANLNDVDLRGADLRSADLSDAKLDRANLRGSNIDRACFYKAICCGVVLPESHYKLKGDTLDICGIRNSKSSIQPMKSTNLIVYVFFVALTVLLVMWGQKIISPDYHKQLQQELMNQPASNNPEITGLGEAQGVAQDAIDAWKTNP